LLARLLPTLGALIRGTGGIPIGMAKQLLGAVLTAADGNPAAIRAADQGLSELDLATAVPAGPTSPDYAKLIDRWTYELD
jgi:hypothetical protein